MIALEKQYDYHQMEQIMRELPRRYPGIVSCLTAGISHDERRIYMLRIGVGLKSLIVTGGIHGRESINATLLLRIAEEYCSAYRNRECLGDCDVYALLQQYSICFLPLVNPDGYEIARTGFSAIHNPVFRQMCKMKRIPYQEWKANARCIDINRNFPCKSYVQQNLLEYPASENETKTLMRIFQDQDSVGYLDFHSRGKLIYYYRHAMTYPYNMRSQRLARYIQSLSHYTLGKREEEQDRLSGGNSVQFYSELTGQPALTIETGEENARFPMEDALLEKTYREIRMIPLGILQLC